MLVADGRPVVMPVYDPATLAIVGFATVQPIISRQSRDQGSGAFVRVVTSPSNNPPAPYFGTGSISLTK